MRLTIISAALALMSSSALAADSMYGQASEFTWSGLYAGIHFGYADGSSDLFVEGEADFPVDPDGFIGGVQIGINHQMANRFVLGAEADITYNSVTGLGVVAAGPAFVDSEIKWSGSARLRAGYAFGRTLPYFAAGVAAAKYHLIVNDMGGGSFKLHDETHIGWTAGVGVEHAFTDRWSARIEYRYSDFGEEDLTALAALGGVANVDLTTHDIRIGLNYRF